MAATRKKSTDPRSVTRRQRSPIAERSGVDFNIPRFLYAPSRVAILLFDGVEELDATGPWEVLSVWTMLFPGDGFEIFCVSRDGNPVKCGRGLGIAAHHSQATMPPVDVLIHPGGKVGPLMSDQAHLAWVKQQRKGVPLMVSVCNGALVYAKAGLLAGRPATTWFGSLVELAQIDASIKVRPNDRFVDDGDIITSAGVSAGIDMALHLVARLSSVAHAKSVRAFIQYDPAPPV